MTTEQAIKNKLRQVEEFEAKHGENHITRSRRKWCTDEQYRANETKFRQAIANTVNNL
jgi:site-specific recombinase